jgi:hypothetical protein
MDGWTRARSSKTRSDGTPQETPETPPVFSEQELRPEVPELRAAEEAVEWEHGQA